MQVWCGEQPPSRRNNNSLVFSAFLNCVLCVRGVLTMVPTLTRTTRQVALILQSRQVGGIADDFRLSSVG